MNRPARRPKRTKLFCERLEDRSNPTKFAISMLSPLTGEIGDTGATHTGSLSLPYSVVTATDATEAVKSAFSGSISVSGIGTYTFSPSNVGEEKPFQIESSGEQFAIAMEDIAGQPGCDWDYNDHVWLMMVREVGPQTVVYSGSATTWVSGPPGGPSNGTATVALTVTENKPGYEGLYYWNYTVTNVDYLLLNPLSQMSLNVAEVGGLDHMASSLGWAGSVTVNPSAPHLVRWQASGGQSPLSTGQSATFSFTTPVTGIGDASGQMGFYHSPPPPGFPGGVTDPVPPGGDVKAPELMIRSVTLWGQPGSAPSAMEAIFGGMSGTILGTNPNAGGGKRIFPEQPKYQTATVYDKVSVRVEMSSSVSENEPVRIQQYDVDDPSSSALPLDDESKDADNRGPIGGINAFTVNVPQGTNYTTFVQPVSVRPGDNYRFAATIDTAIRLFRDIKPRVSSSVPATYSDGWAAVYYDAGLGDPVALSNSRTVQSELLTVWRTLHVERDHMGAPPGTEVFDGATDDVNPGGALADADISWAQTEYLKAYIVLADDLAAHNTRTEVAWNRNIEAAEFDTVAAATRDVSPTTPSVFWVMHLISAYEGPEDKDGDGPVAEDTVLGQTNADTATSITYSECIRDAIALYLANFDGSGQEPNTVAAATRYNVFHESLHVFNLPHSVAANNVGPFAESAATLGFGTGNYMHPVHNDKIRKKDVPNNTPT